MKERPILFSGAMVRAILSGQKAQTRRRVHPDWLEALGDPDTWTARGVVGWEAFDHLANETRSFQSPYGQPGDRLWVRETWGFRGRQLSSMDKANALTFIQYQADGARREIVRNWDDESGLPKQREPREGESRENYDDYLRSCWRAWRPSIHMPQWASRLTLEVTEVRVQRLQEISEEDALAEGCWRSGRPEDLEPPPFGAFLTHREEFQSLWDSINGERQGCSWSDNPWVWCVSFRRAE